MDLEVLESIHKEILLELKGIPDGEAFYLTGGTALAGFYLFHRKSNDLDIFTSVEELINPFSLKMEKILNEKGWEVKRSRSFSSFVELFITSTSGSTIIHIAVDSPFRFEKPVESREFPGVKIDSLVDIATNKLLALFGRASLRDFVDVYFLVKEKLNKTELIEKSKLKDPGLDLYWLGVSMEKINLFSMDSPDMPVMIKPCRLEDVRFFFNDWIKEIRAQMT